MLTLPCKGSPAPAGAAAPEAATAAEATSEAPASAEASAPESPAEEDGREAASPTTAAEQQRKSEEEQQGEQGSESGHAGGRLRPSQSLPRERDARVGGDHLPHMLRGLLQVPAGHGVPGQLQQVCRRRAGVRATGGRATATCQGRKRQECNAGKFKA